MMKKSRRMVKNRPFSRFIPLTTAAAALSSMCCHAWIPAATTSRALHKNTRSSPLRFFDSPIVFQHQATFGVQSSPWRGGTMSPKTRLYSSKNNNNKGEGLLSKIGKKILPTRLFGSDEEKKKLAKKKEARDQMNGTLDAMLKDAPLGVRMMAKMVTPIISTVASGLSDVMAEQQRTTEGIMDDARGYLVGDPAVSGLLGEPIQLGAPFSQSSSTSSINGQTQTRVQLAMSVTGSRLSGTVQVLATQDGIAQMQVDAGGRRIDVNLLNRGSAGSSTVFGASSSSSSRISDDDNIIEAEIIDKESK